MEMEWWMRDVALFSVCYLFSLFCFPTSSPHIAVPHTHNHRVHVVLPGFDPKLMS